MLTLVAITALFACAAAFENRDGASGDVRIFNFLNTNVEGANALPAVLAGTIAQDVEFNSATVSVDVEFSNDVSEQVFASVPASTTPFNNALFTQVDLEGQPRTAVVTVLGNTEELEVRCSPQIQPDQRSTIVLTQSVQGEFVPEPTCLVANGVCNQIDDLQKTAGRVTVTCQVFNENLNSIEDSCTTDPVNIWREDPLADPQYIFRADDALPSTDDDDDDAASLNVEASERIIIAEQLASSPTGASPDIREDLNQNIRYQIRPNGGSTTEDIMPDPPARRHDVFWGPGFFITQSLKTGRVAVLNAAYRTSVDGTQLDNVFDFEIAQNDIAAHAQLDLATGQPTQFIELPVGTYQFRVFTDESIQTLFGQRANQIAKSATALNQLTITITADQYSVVVIQGGTNDISAGAPTLEQIDITNTGLVDEGTTEFEVFNLIQGLPLVFAEPDTDCCNFINNRQAIQVGSGGSVTFNSASLVSTTFNAYSQGAQCPSLLSSLIEPDALTFQRNANGNECERKAIFLIGRAGEFEQQASGQGVCNECTNDVPVVKTLNTLGAINSQGSQITQVEITVPMCDCGVVVNNVDPCDVCEADEFSNLESRIVALNAAIASSNDNLEDDFDDISDNFRDLDRDLNGIEKDVLDVESAVGDLSSGLGDIDSALDDLDDSIDSLKKRV